MERFKWPTPSDRYFSNRIANNNSGDMKLLVDRCQYLWEEFGPPTDMLLLGGLPAMYALDELKYSYMYGNFMAVVLLAQIFLEMSLGGSYTLAGNDNTANGRFADRLKASVKDGLITAELAKQIDELRKMRNVYSHHSSGAGERTYIRRLMNSRVAAPEELLLSDARHAIRVVADYLRQGSPDWSPLNYQWDEESESVVSSN